MPQQRGVDVLIAGAGISGLLLARELQARGRRVAIAHDPSRTGAGEASVGLLNPVRGQRYTLAWRAAEVFGEAIAAYRTIGAAAGKDLFRSIPVIRAFSSSEERALWERRVSQVEAAGFPCREQTKVPAGLRRFAHGAVEISGGGAVDPRGVLDTLRAEQHARGSLVERACTSEECTAGSDGISWRGGGVHARWIVLAGGAADIGHALLRRLSLRPVKGESLLVRAPDLDDSATFVCGHHLAPVARGLWACGGTKVPGDTDPMPTHAGRAELTAFLEAHLDADWEIERHWSGVRAVTMDTRPVAGPLERGGRVIVLNGLGSQGFSVAPWLARVLADHLCDAAPLPPEILPARFETRSPPGISERRDATGVAREWTLRHLVPGDLAVDLTVGRGGDTIWLAEAVGPEGAVLGVDVQAAAIDATRQRVARSLPASAIELVCADHASIASVVPEAWRGRIGAAVATLGLLPGSTSPVATRAATTVQACAGVLPLLRVSGMLSIVIAANHAGGLDERRALERWTSSLDASRFTATWWHVPGGSDRMPAVLSIVRRAT